MVVDAWIRGGALFLGLFTALNLVAERNIPGFDANLWWIDLHVLPASVRFVLLAATALSLLAYAIAPPRGRRWRNLVALPCLISGLFALWNTIMAITLFSTGAVRAGFPIPFSAFVVLGLTAVVVRLVTAVASPRLGAGGVVRVVAGAAFCAFVFPLLQLVCFGMTDYRRPVDIAVVFGARTFASGKASRPLADRVRTGCDLYQERLTRRLLFTGGPGDGKIDEPEAMRRLAVSSGVSPAAIVKDSNGVNTEASARTTSQIMHSLGVRRAAAVSHFYHLPRIKMTYQRYGWNVVTVPARIDRFTPDMYYSMAREVAALWMYYLRGLRRPTA